LSMEDVATFLGISLEKVAALKGAIAS